MIYLDYNATTPVDTEVAAAMKPWLDEKFGNPSSLYYAGRDARNAVEHAREQVAALINASPAEIVFTSGGTESDNYAIKGIAYAYREKGNHIIVSEIEHPAVLEVCKYLERQGFRITYLPVDSEGRVSPKELSDAIVPSTILISVMHSNNEVGTIQDIRQLAEIAHSRGVFFHTDAAQSAGKTFLDVRDLDVELLTIAGHKLYAPKGIGALYIRQGVHPEKLIHGASQELNRRAGTENTLEIIGLGKACEIARRDLEQNISHMKQMRDRLREKLQKQLPFLKFNGHPEFCLPNTLSVSFPGIDAQTLLSELSEVAASPGAACHADGQTISHVLKAMKIPEKYLLGTIRFSTGRLTTTREIDEAAILITGAYERLVPASDSISQFSAAQEIKLTSFTHGLGCACKLHPDLLEDVLKDFPLPQSERLLVGLDTGDDAAVYLISENTALVQTLDFFTPVCDNPFDYGSIAAANALSDIYAMGADPLFALNIAGFPHRRLPLSVLREIFMGANEKLKEAGIFVAGGHTVENNEPLFGMCVTGTVHPVKIWRNTGAMPGDALILTKPLGSGIIATATKMGIATSAQVNEAIGWMRTLNAKASSAMKRFTVKACTDITGFGLIGHLYEMIKGSGTSATLKFASIPLMHGVKELALKGAVPGGTRSNYQAFNHSVRWDSAIDEISRLILCDAQTSGGLLFCIPENESSLAVDSLMNDGIPATVVGMIVAGDESQISVRV